MPNEASEMI